jgi:RES domain-containing protein
MPFRNQSFCCPECFSHPWLRTHIQETSTKKGQCDYCATDDVPVVEVGDLCQYFDNLLSMYAPFQGDEFATGEALIWRVQGGWDVFNEALLDLDDQAQLLEDIANSDWDDDDGESPLDANELYVIRGAPWHSSHADLWGEFCDRVRENPNEPLPFHEYYEENLEKVRVILPPGTLLYRARPGFELDERGRRKPYTGHQIGAPPQEKATVGRASKEGQVVLYCADQEKTAIAEVRPARGFRVSVCSIRVTREVRIVDLTVEIASPNPFLSPNPLYEIEVLELLEAFAEDMSKPLERDDDLTYYVPCQRLAHYIEAAGYDGIRFPSALNPGGTNVVLFNPNVAEILESKLVQVTHVSVDYEEEQKQDMERVWVSNVGP